MPVPTSARAIVTDYLNQYGLGSLADWAWSTIQQAGSVDLGMRVIKAELPSQAAFQARFPGIALRQQRGLPALSPAQYLQLEAQYREIGRGSGLPPEFYDDPTDLGALIGNDVSPNEFRDRIDQGFQRVAAAPPEVRDAFSRYFGVQGDTALAMYFTDPNKASPILMRQASQAILGGRAAQEGLALGVGATERLATSVGEQAAGAAISQASKLKPLTVETASELQDLTEEQAVLGLAGTDAGFGQQLRRRAQTREAQMQGGGQQAVTQEGVLGAGTARR